MKTGKTTRVVDAAIQRLFARGVIKVPMRPGIEKMSSGAFKDCIVDPDWETSYSVQRSLFSRILRRLSSEHKGQYIVDRNKFTIRLCKESTAN